jgi:membrane-bound serine protease (ClpP class)
MGTITRYSLVFACLSLIAMLALPRAFAEQATAPASTTASHKTVVVAIDGTIDESTVREVEKRFAQARQLGADTVILRLDTPGGLAIAGLDISRFLKQQDDLHVIAYVQRMALSAGIMVGMAADEIVMQPGSMIGDSAPISIGAGGGIVSLGETERAKAESPILADFRDSATKNGYDPLLAEAMVSVGRVVHWVQDADKLNRRFVDGNQYADLSKAGWSDVVEPGVPIPVDAADTLLTVSADTAVKLGLAKGMAPSVQALADQRGLSIVATYEKSAGTAFIDWLGNPWIRALLLTIFIQSLIIALHTPGHGGAEAICLVSLGLLIGVPLLTGYAQWWEICAILLGLALIAVEIFVIPGFGVAGVTGILLMLFGFIMTFVGNSPEIPGSWRLPGSMRGVQNGLAAVVGGLVCSFFLTLWLRRYLPKLPFFNRLILASPTTPSTTTIVSTGEAATTTDAWPFIGTVGLAVSELKPGGTATFPYGDDQRTASVVSDSGFVPAGGKVTVREISGNRVVVRQA